MANPCLLMRFRQLLTSNLARLPRRRCQSVLEFRHAADTENINSSVVHQRCGHYCSRFAVVSLYT